LVSAIFGYKAVKYTFYWLQFIFSISNLKVYSIFKCKNTHFSYLFITALHHRNVEEAQDIPNKTSRKKAKKCLLLLRFVGWHISQGSQKSISNQSVFSEHGHCFIPNIVVYTVENRIAPYLQCT
jgi:hypothetical protein